MDTARLVALLNDAADMVERTSGLLLNAADKATEVLDTFAGAVGDMANDLSEQREPDAESGGSEKPTPEYMYEYLRQKSPRMYDHPGTKRLLLENGERGYTRLKELFEAVLLQEQVQRDKQRGSSWGEAPF